MGSYRPALSAGRRANKGEVMKVFVFAALLLVVPFAQDKPAPALTVEQKQAIQILAQRIELAQLRAQAAQSDFDKARGELAGLLQSLHKDGFDLNLQTMEYTKKPEPPKAPEKKKDGSP